MTLDHLWTALGWIAFALNIWGNLRLTNKSLSGWVIRTGCNVCWLPYSVYTHAWALLANHLSFMLINAHGWWKWKNDELRNRNAGDVPVTSPAGRRQQQAYTDGYNACRRDMRRRGGIR